MYKTPVSVSANGEETASFVKKMTDDEFKDYLQKQSDSDRFHLKLNTSMTFDSSKDIGHVRILNPASNKYVIQVQTYLDGKTDIIYDSGKISPEFYVEEGKLIKEITKGVYKTQNVITYYERNTNEKIGETLVVGQLSVNN